MTYIRTIPEEDAAGPVATMYAAERERVGSLPNFYELATLAAARPLRSSYCALAHGAVLLREGLGEDAVCDSAGLSETELAVMELADKVAGDAPAVTREDVDRLHALGLADEEILDVVLAAGARCFFSTVLDALGVEPDARFAQLPPRVREALTVGRPLAALSAG